MLKIKDIELDKLKEFLESHLSKELHFAIYTSDNVFIYELPLTDEDHLTGFEVCISANDIFICTQTLNDLFNKSEITFFSVTEFKFGQRITDTYTYRPLLKEP